MTTTFLAGVLRRAEGKAVARTVTVRGRDDLRGLSYYTVCALSDTMGSDPFTAIEARREVWVVDLDADGNFVRAECLGAALNCTENQP